MQIWYKINFSISGVIADTARVLRMLLARVEDRETGAVTVPELNCEVPEAHQKYVDTATCILNEKVRGNPNFLV